MYSVYSVYRCILSMITLSQVSRAGSWVGIQAAVCVVYGPRVSNNVYEQSKF